MLLTPELEPYCPRDVQVHLCTFSCRKELSQWWHGHVNYGNGLRRQLKVSVHLASKLTCHSRCPSNSFFWFPSSARQSKDWPSFPKHETPLFSSQEQKVHTSYRLHIWGKPSPTFSAAATHQFSDAPPLPNQSTWLVFHVFHFSWTTTSRRFLLALFLCQRCVIWWKFSSASFDCCS